MKQQLPSVFDAPVVVVGGGVTGLTVAHLLAEAGVQVVILERQDTLGGLGRSFRYDGFNFDVGPHRFHTANPDVTAYLGRILGDRSLFFPRLSEVYFSGSYYRWPLQPKELVQLPPEMAARSGIDLLLNSFRHYDIDSFETYVLRQYGPTLYAHFFSDYSQKFLGIPPRETHPDWAKAGINRAIIDDKLQMQNLSQLLRSTFLQYKKTEIDFIYPREGMHVVWDLVREQLEARGARILTGVDARMEPGPGNRIQAVHAGAARFESSRVIWTGSIPQANAQLGLSGLNLPYRALLLYNVLLEADTPRRYQWCYYGESTFLISRVSMPRFFSAHTCPPGTTGLCVEVACQEGDERWMSAEGLTDWVVEDLIRVGMIRERSAIRDVHLERVANAYPVYHRSYPVDLEAAQKALGPWTNLHMAGRNGTFWYNNMDHCIEAAFTLVRRLLHEGGRPVEEKELAAGLSPAPRPAR